MRLFIADQQLAKAIEPGERDFHDPSPRARATAALRALLAARADVRRVSCASISLSAGMPTKPASAHRSCGVRGVTGGRGTTKASRVAPSWLTSCRLAPLTMSDSGMPCASTSSIRLLPFPPPAGRIGADRLLGERGLHQRAVDTLPAPGNALHLVVLGHPCLPEGAEDAGPLPLEKPGVNGAGAAKPLGGQRIPLAKK